MLATGQLKQVVAKVYNSVNQEFFGVGVIHQKVYITDSKIIVVAINRRIPALAALDTAGVRTREIDYVLLDSFKKRFKEQIESELGLSVETVLKDYDPKTEVAGTIVVLNGTILEGTKKQ